MMGVTPAKTALNRSADVFAAGALSQLWVTYVSSLTLILITATHMLVTNISDNLGFSGNSDFYYANLHPIRTMLRTAALVLGRLATSNDTTGSLRALPTKDFRQR
jgi:hypothetical protein